MGILIFLNYFYISIYGLLLYIYLFIYLPISGTADNFPLLAEDSWKSHSAEGKTKDNVVVLIAHVAYISPVTARRIL